MPTARHGGQLPKLAGYQLPSRCDDESSTEEQLAPSSGYGLTRCDAGPTVAEPINLLAGKLGQAEVLAARLLDELPMRQPG